LTRGKERERSKRREETTAQANKKVHTLFSLPNNVMRLVPSGNMVTDENLAPMGEMRRYRMAHLGVDGRIITIWILNKLDRRVWNGFMWLTTLSKNEFLCTRQWILGIHTWRGISW
jgi:hypothetical protein